MKKQDLEARWRLLMESFDIGHNIDTFWKVFDLWSGNDRHYHNIDHLKWCLNRFDTVVHLLEQPHLVELALWYHDAIHGINRNTDYESLCAELTIEHFMGIIDSSSLSYVRRYIMATKHYGNVTKNDSKYIADIDLSIVGSDEDVYTKYLDNVRNEYISVGISPSDFDFYRARVLKGFLNKPNIFHTSVFNMVYGNKAILNMSRELQKLHYKERGIT